MKNINSSFKTLSQILVMLILCAVMGCVSVSVNKRENAVSNEAQNKATMRRFIEAVYHQKNMAVFDEVIAENCILHDNEKTIESLETAKRQIRMVTGMYRDIQVTIDDIIAEGDFVAMRATFKGISRRNGNKIISPSITMCRYADGKMIEIWRTFDNAYIFRQLGIKPPTAQ